MSKSINYMLDDTKSILLYQGSKTDWRTRANLEILIIEHFSVQCLEMICYNSTASTESPRIYLKTKLLHTKFDKNEIEEAMRLKKEVFLRKKKTPDAKILTDEINKKLSCQYILQRLYIKEGVDFEVGLKAMSTDLTREINTIDEDGNAVGTGVHVLDVVLDKLPDGFTPTTVEYPKQVTGADFDYALRKFRQEQNNLTRETSYAELAVTSIEGFKAAMSSRMQRELELKRSYSPARLLWVNAINRVLIQNYIAKVTIRLDEIDEKYRKIAEEESKRLKITPSSSPTKPSPNKLKAQRRTMDNSQISLTKLPSVGRNVSSSPLSPGDQDHLSSPSYVSLPPISEWNNLNPNDASFKARRRQRANYNERKQCMGLTSMVGSQSEKRIPSIEEILGSSNKVVPSLQNSYSQYAYNKLKNEGASIRLESINRRKLSSVSFDQAGANVRGS